MAMQKQGAQKAPQAKMPQRVPKKAEFVAELRDMADEWKQKALGVVSHWEKFKNILQNNYELGRSHLVRGNTQDAVLRFRFVLWLDPKYRDSWYWLGCSYVAAGDLKRAREALLKALKQTPDSEEARYMLALVMGKAMPKGELPRVIPKSILLEQFDATADIFNAQQDELQYEGHSLLCNAVRAATTPGRIDHVILDLGVGTGLCGQLVRDLAAHLTGVDFSEKMLAEAMKLSDDRGKKVYDALLKREIVEFISDGPDTSYDIILAAAVVGYLGDLLPLFQQSARLLRAGGIFAFTADATQGGGYQFDPEIGRFRYSQPYLNDLAARFGLSEFRCREAAVYPESAGLLCVYRKN